MKCPGGSQLKVIIEHTVNGLLDGRIIPWELWVVENLIYDAILGSDFLYKNKMIIDNGKKSIYIQTTDKDSCTATVVDSRYMKINSDDDLDAEKLWRMQKFIAKHRGKIFSPSK